MNWEDVVAFRRDHCHKCEYYHERSKEQTGTERCKLVSGTNSSYAIETGQCKFEEKTE